MSAAAKGRIVLPSQLELVVCLGRYKQQASTHAQLTSRKVHRIERGWVGESACTRCQRDVIMLTVHLDHAYCTDVQAADAS